MSAGTPATDRIERLQALCGVFGALGVVVFGLQLLLMAALFTAEIAAKSMLEWLHEGAGDASLPWPGTVAIGGFVAWVVTKFMLAARLRQLGTMLVSGESGGAAKLRRHAKVDMATNLAFAVSGLGALVALAIHGELDGAPCVSLASLLVLITLLMLLFPARVIQVLGDAEVVRELGRRTDIYEELWRAPAEGSG